MRRWLRRQRLPPLSGPEGTGELGDRENASPVILHDLLGAHTAQEAQVVLCHGLRVAPLAELTEGAVAIEDPPRWRTRLEVPELLERPPSLPILWVQRDPADRTAQTVHQDAITRLPPLERSQDQAIQFQQGPLDLGAPLGVMKEHRKVMEVPEPRRSRSPLEGVETHSQPLVLHGGVQHEWHAALEHRWRHGQTAQDLTGPILVQQFVDRHQANARSLPLQEPLVVGGRPQFPDEFQIAFVPALQVTFQDLRGDLRGHRVPPHADQRFRYATVRRKCSLFPNTSVRNLLVFPVSYAYNRRRHEVCAGHPR